jgi:tetratricopeptide (TPR) repeat protein
LVAGAYFFLCLLPAAAGAHGDLYERIAHLTQKITHDPRNAALHLQRGEIHRRHRAWGAAQRDYDRAAQLDPTLTDVDLARGKLLLAARRPQAARTALDRFLRQRPDHPEALLARARTFVKLRQPAAAARDFTQVIDRVADPAPDLYLERAQAQVATGPATLADAVRGLDEGIARLGSLVTLQQQASELEIRLHRYAQALQRLDQLAAQAQRKETWLARKGDVLVRAGRTDEARQAFTDALAAIDALPPSHRHHPATRKLISELHSRLESPKFSRVPHPQQEERP